MSASEVTKGPSVTQAGRGRASLGLSAPGTWVLLGGLQPPSALVSLRDPSLLPSRVSQSPMLRHPGVPQ